MRLVIASRQSDLARIQAYAVGEALQKKNPDLKIEYHFRESLGDKNLSDPLWKMPERGVFTEDFHKGLIDGEYDIVVHSWKDLPVEERPGTAIVATMAREDMRDVLLLKKEARGASSLRILTSSPRRHYNLSSSLRDLLPNSPRDIAFEPVRGNVQTRVRKLLEGEQHGLVVAKAALDRMLAAGRVEFQETKTFLRSALEKLNWMILPLTLNPAAAAQGALAIEAKAGREDLEKILKSIHDPATFSSVQEERRLLKGWGGGCHQKIGVAVFDRDYGRVVLARGVRDSGERIDIRDVQSPAVWKSGAPVAENLEWFDRVEIPWDVDPARFDAHWISKAEALPSGARLGTEDLVWTSGISTWRALARRGIWVNGSAESFGENEDMRAGPLAGARRWLKWTHASGAPFSLGDTIKTYKLVAKAVPPRLDDRAQHYYWKSGSAFLEALKHNPWLLKKEHWSGPGHTHETLSRVLGRAAHIALDAKQWQTLVQQGKKS